MTAVGIQGEIPKEELNSKIAEIKCHRVEADVGKELFLELIERTCTYAKSTGM